MEAYARCPHRFAMSPPDSKSRSGHHPTGRPIPYRHVVSSDGRSTADEIARLADLRDRGVISEEEFQQAKAKAIS